MDEPSNRIMLKGLSFATKKMLWSVRDTIGESDVRGVIVVRHSLEALTGYFNGEKFEEPQGFHTKELAEKSIGYILGSLESKFDPKHALNLSGGGHYTLNNFALMHGISEGGVSVKDAVALMADILAASDAAGITPWQQNPSRVRGGGASPKRSPKS